MLLEKYLLIKMKETSDGVEVSGARGRAPTTTYKISATYLDGYKVKDIFQITEIEKGQRKLNHSSY